MEELLKMVTNYGLGIVLAIGVFWSQLKLINWLITKHNKQLETLHEISIKLIDRFNRFDDKLDRLSP